MRILIIENEIKTASYIQKGLIESGFNVEMACDGEEGLYLAREYVYDCIVLDIMLPKLDGWQILSILRKQSIATPVICLTARDSIDDRVKGLELGAEDYLIKPFSFSELLARIRRILRTRSEITPEKQLSLADMQIDILSRKVIRAGKQVYLSAKEFMLLQYLIEHQCEVVSRTRIAEKVWDIHFASDSNIIDVAVRRLRKKCDEGFSQKLIHTVRGVGYVAEAR